MSKSFYAVRTRETERFITELTLAYDETIDIEITVTQNYIQPDSSIHDLSLDLVVNQYDSFVGCKQELIHVTRYSKCYSSVSKLFLPMLLNQLEKAIDVGNLDFEEQGFTLEGYEIYE